MSPRPPRKRSALDSSAAAVIAPTAAPAGADRTAGSAGRSARASIASKIGNAGNAGEPGSGSDAEERVVKVTARVGENLAGRCRAAYIDGLLRGGPVSFEAWIADAMREKLARAEEERGRAYEPLPSDRIPKGRRN